MGSLSAICMNYYITLSLSLTLSLILQKAIISEQHVTAIRLCGGRVSLALLDMFLVQVGFDGGDG